MSRRSRRRDTAHMQPGLFVPEDHIPPVLEPARFPNNFNRLIAGTVIEEDLKQAENPLRSGPTRLLRSSILCGFSHSSWSSASS